MPTAEFSWRNFETKTNTIPISDFPSRGIKRLLVPLRRTKFPKSIERSVIAMNTEASRTRRTPTTMTSTMDTRGSSAATAASFEVRCKR